MAKSEVPGYNVKIKQPFFFRVADILFQNFTVDELTVLLSVCFVLCLGIFLTRYFRPAGYSFLRAVVVLLSIIFLICCFSLAERINRIGKEAIILTPNAIIRFEPFQEANIFFELSQGSKVEVLQQKESWAKIKRSDGKTGWIIKNSLGYIS